MEVIGGVEEGSPIHGRYFELSVPKRTKFKKLKRQDTGPITRCSALACRAIGH